MKTDAGARGGTPEATAAAGQAGSVLPQSHLRLELRPRLDFRPLASRAVREDFCVALITPQLPRPPAPVVSCRSPGYLVPHIISFSPFPSNCDQGRDRVPCASHMVGAKPTISAQGPGAGGAPPCRPSLRGTPTGPHWVRCSVRS